MSYIGGLYESLPPTGSDILVQCPWICSKTQMRKTPNTKKKKHTKKKWALPCEGTEVEQSSTCSSHIGHSLENSIGDQRTNDLSVYINRLKQMKHNDEKKSEETGVTYVALHILRTGSENLLPISSQATPDKSRARSRERITKRVRLRICLRHLHPRLRSHVIIHLWHSNKNQNKDLTVSNWLIPKFIGTKKQNFFAPDS